VPRKAPPAPAAPDGSAPPEESPAAAEAAHASLLRLLDALPVGVAVVDAASGETTYANPAAAALDEAPDGGGRWRAFLPTGEPLPADDSPVARVLRGDGAGEAELLLRGPDGQERVVLASGVAVHDDDGQVTHAAVSLVDVTERQRLEAELVRRTRALEQAASEAALRAEEARALREIGRALASELDPDVVLRMAATSAMELLGARGAAVTARSDDGQIVVAPGLGTLAAMEGRRFPVAGTVVEMASRERRSFAFASLDDVPPTTPVAEEARRLGLRNLLFCPLQAHDEPLGVLVAVDRDGGFGPQEVRLMEALADAAALAIRNAAMLERERRRAEENRALLAAAEALTSSLDPDVVMTRIVEIAAELVGADGAGLTMLLDAETVSFPVAVGCLAPFRRAASPLRGTVTERVLAGGAPVLLDADTLDDAPEATRLVTRLGITQYAVVPLRADGETFGVLAAVSGRGSRRITGDDLRRLTLLGNQAAVAVRNARAHEAAQAASRAKSRFLAVMSHELRTPLNALAGYASLMGDGLYGPVSDGQRTALERMGAAREHLLALIDQVLELARTEAGQRPVEPADVDVAALAREVGDALRPAAEEKGLALVVTADGTLPVRTDGPLLRQALANLVENAVKFTEAGGVELRVLLAGDEVVAEVDDTGPGIPAELAERVFEPFFQGDASATTRRQGGTGLGLAIAREFARLLGGDVTLHSAPGAGSTFTLRLPHAPASAPEGEMEIAADDAPAAESLRTEETAAETTEAADPAEPTEPDAVAEAAEVVAPVETAGSGDAAAPSEAAGSAEAAATG
jgi:signal transduction histidine kinase